MLYDHPPVVRLLLRRGAATAFRDRSGRTARQLAEGQQQCGRDTELLALLSKDV